MEETLQKRQLSVPLPSRFLSHNWPIVDRPQSQTVDRPQSQTVDRLKQTLLPRIANHSKSRPIIRMREILTRRVCQFRG